MIVEAPTTWLADTGRLTPERVDALIGCYREEAERLFPTGEDPWECAGGEPTDDIVVPLGGTYNKRFAWNAMLWAEPNISPETMFVALSLPHHHYGGGPGAGDWVEPVAERGGMTVGRVLVAVERLWIKGFLTFRAGYAPKPRARRKRSKKTPIPPELRWEVWERDDFTCKECGSRRNLQVDHIYPESLGGETVLSNLQTLCKRCNVVKGTKVPA